MQPRRNREPTGRRQIPVIIFGGPSDRDAALYPIIQSSREDDDPQSRNTVSRTTWSARDRAKKELLQPQMPGTHVAYILWARRWGQGMKTAGVGKDVP
jgi:hypothetical protein